jgi:hypothetical protein
VLQAVSGAPGQPADRQRLQELSVEANKGKFVASGGSLNKSSRPVVQEGKGQGAVWDEVGQVNEKSKARTGSSDFTANYVDRNVVQQLQGYLDQVQSPVAQRRQVVGVVVAVNGKAEAADVFGSTPLFLKLWPKLLTVTHRDSREVVSFSAKSAPAADAKPSAGFGGSEHSSAYAK